MYLRFCVRRSVSSFQVFLRGNCHISNHFAMLRVIGDKQKLCDKMGKSPILQSNPMQKFWFFFIPWSWFRMNQCSKVVVLSLF